MTLHQSAAALKVSEGLTKVDIDLEAVLEALVEAKSSGRGPAFEAAIDQTHRAMTKTGSSSTSPRRSGPLLSTKFAKTSSKWLSSGDS